MIILFDVGNSNITIAIADLEKIRQTFRLKTIISKTADEYYLSIKEMISNEKVEAIVISSVVPDLTNILKEMANKYFKINPLIFGAGIKTGIQIKTDNPKEVGSDLIADSVGALEYGDEVLIVDLGTANKFIYVKNCAFIGCTISPGIHVALKALVDSTSLLPAIDIKVPEKILGKNTINSMQSGVVYGAASEVDGMIYRIKKEQNNPYCKVVATGGLSRLIVPLCREEIIQDDNLMFKGMLKVYKKNL